MALTSSVIPSPPASSHCLKEARSFDLTLANISLSAVTTGILSEPLGFSGTSLWAASSLVVPASSIMPERS